MKTPTSPRTLAVLIAACLLALQPVARAGDEAEAVKAATKQFYAALNAMFQGELAPMNKVWSHKPDVTYMGPGGGIQVGWKKVWATWEAQAAQKLGGSVKPKNTHTVIGKDIAVVQNYELAENTNADGKVQKVTIRATNIFRRENGAWKMIGHHTDPLPYVAR